MPLSLLPSGPGELAVEGHHFVGLIDEAGIDRLADRIGPDRHAGTDAVVVDQAQLEVSLGSIRIMSAAAAALFAALMLCAGSSGSTRRAAMDHAPDQTLLYPIHIALPHPYQ